MAPDERRRRAIARALANGGASCVRRLRYGLYAVESASRPGSAHRVSVDEQGHYHCSCEAGVNSIPCWHAAAVYVAKVEAGGGRVTGPTAADVEPGADRELVLDDDLSEAA